jgi:hypothetical protein
LEKSTPGPVRVPRKATCPRLFRTWSKLADQLKRVPSGVPGAWSPARATRVRLSGLRPVQSPLPLSSETPGPLSWSTKETVPALLTSGSLKKEEKVAPPAPGAGVPERATSVSGDDASAGPAQMPSRWSKGTPKLSEAWKATLPVALMSGTLKEENVPSPPVPGATELERTTG